MESTRRKIESGEEFVKHLRRSKNIDIPYKDGSGITFMIDNISIGLGTKSIRTKNTIETDEYTDNIKNTFLKFFKYDYKNGELINYDDTLKDIGTYTQSFTSYEFTNHRITYTVIANIIDILIKFCNTYIKTRNIFIVLKLMHRKSEYNIVVSRSVRSVKNTDELYTSVYSYGSMSGCISGHDPQYLRDVKSAISAKNVKYKTNTIKGEK